MRKYTLPTGCRMASVVSNLSSDGVLMITAPKNVSIEAAEAKNVPIQLQKDQSWWWWERGDEKTNNTNNINNTRTTKKDNHLWYTKYY